METGKTTLDYQTPGQPPPAGVEIRHYNDGVSILVKPDGKEWQSRLVGLAPFGVVLVFLVAILSAFFVGQPPAQRISSLPLLCLIFIVGISIPVTKAVLLFARRGQPTVIAVGPKLLTIISPGRIIARRTWPRSRVVHVEVARLVNNRTGTPNRVLRIQCMYDVVELLQDNDDLDLIAAELCKILPAPDPTKDIKQQKFITRRETERRQ